MVPIFCLLETPAELKINLSCTRPVWGPGNPDSSYFPPLLEHILRPDFPLAYFNFLLIGIKLAIISPFPILLVNYPESIFLVL